jgi:hypothetical protein
MKDKPLIYKTTWKPVEFKPEFIEAQAKRMTEINMRYRELEDGPIPSLTDGLYRPLVIVCGIVGAVIGGVAGWFIAGMLFK